MKLVPKKIIIVFNSLEIGGIETKIIDLCQYFSKSPEIKVFLILKNKNGPLLINILSNIQIIHSKITPIFKLKTILFPFWLALIFRKIKPDLIITFGNYSSICTVVGKTISRSKSKLVISEDSSIIEQIESDKLAYFRKKLVLYTYPLADKIITLTDVGKSKLLYLFPKLESKIIIKKNWLPLNYSFNLKKINNKKTIGILFLARFEPQKDPLKFLRIIKMLIQKNQKIKVFMVGDGSFKSIIEKYIKKNRLSNYVSIKPSTTKAYKYFQKSKLLLLTSKHEGFPLTILESLAANCIPICNSLPEIKGFFKYQSQYILYNSNQNACKKIMYLLNTPKTRKALLNYYQKKVKTEQLNNFTSTIKVFQDLL